RTIPRILPKASTSSSALVIGGSCALQAASPRERPDRQVDGSARLPPGALCEPVDLGCDDVVVAGQAVAGGGPERDNEVSPGHGQFGVMELTFGEQGDPGGEAERVAEVAEGEFPAEPTDAVSLPAIVPLPVQPPGFAP